MFEGIGITTIILVIGVISVLGGFFVTVQQGTVSVITMFGKYRRVLYPGLNFKIPFIEVVFRRISIQNQSIELQFQAITQDQANVNFKAMLLYSVINQTEETIKDVAFKFIDFGSLMQTLNRTVEGSVVSRSKHFGINTIGKLRWYHVKLCKSAFRPKWMKSAFFTSSLRPKSSQLNFSTSICAKQLVIIRLAIATKRSILK